MGMKRIGTNQISCLEAMEQHGGWRPGSGWEWSNYSTTIRIMDGLERRGLTENIGQPLQSRQEHYILTDAGREFLAERKRLKPPQNDVNEALLTAIVDGEGVWSTKSGFWVKSVEYTKLCMASLERDGYVEKRPEGRWVVTYRGTERGQELGSAERLALYED